MSRSSKNAIGSLRKLEGPVRYKFGEGLIWQDAQSGVSEALMTGDSVFTGDEGRADLSMKNGTAFQILSNTLVVIDPFEVEGGGLRLENGNLKLDLSHAKGALTLKVQGKAYEIKSDGSSGFLDIASPTGEEGLRISNEGSGKVSIKDKASGQRALELSADGSLMSSSDGSLKIDTMPLKPIFPVRNEVFLRSEQKPTVDFRWKRIRQIEDVNSIVKIEFRGPQNSQVQIPSNITNASVPLVVGRYKWRILLIGSQGETQKSAWNSFVVQEYAPPKLLSPVNGTVVPPGLDGKRNVVFRWSSAFDPSISEFEIVEKRDEDSDSPDAKVHKFNVNSNEKVLSVKAGKYAWRVRSLIPGAQGSADSSALTSSWFEFVIAQGMARSPLLGEEKKVEIQPEPQVQRAPSAKRVIRRPPPPVKIMPIQQKPVIQPQPKPAIRKVAPDDNVFYP